MTAPLTQMTPHQRQEVLHEVAVTTGVCVRPISQRLTDTVTGDVRIVAVPCGSTRAKQCPSCAEHNRQARYWQCREGWHLTYDPAPDTPDDPGSDHEDDTDPVGDDDGVSGRVVRSTRRRDDVPEFPIRPPRAGTLGRSFESRDGHRYVPSMFITLTLPSYGRVDADGVPRDPRSYDYRRAALDAMHFSKLIDRFIQNLRRCAGYKVQYFAAIEPQRRGAPHVHIAVRGTLPRKDVLQVIAATYHQVWWPRHDRPRYTSAYPTWDTLLQRYVDPATGLVLPTWDTLLQRYVDPATGLVLPTWEDSLPGIEDDPAYVLRFGTTKGQDVQGFIAGGKADRRIGYLTKYLTKTLADDLDTDNEEAQDKKLARRRAARREHLDRLHDVTRFLPCSPECANWLRYGVQPRDPRPGMQPGECPRRAHKRDNLGYGGRRVLVSRYWTGKTLAQAKADRAEVVREALAAAGIDADNHDQYSATTTRPDGQARYMWEPVRHDDLDTPTYTRLIATAIRQRQHWRTQYQQARQHLAKKTRASSAIVITEGDPA